MLSPALHRSPLQFSALNASTEFATPPFFALLWNDVGTICLTGQMVDGRKERHLSFLLIFLHSDSRAVKCRRQSFQVPSCQAIPSTTTCFTGTNSESLGSGNVPRSGTESRSKAGDNLPKDDESGDCADDSGKQRKEPKQLFNQTRKEKTVNWKSQIPLKSQPVRR